MTTQTDLSLEVLHRSFYPSRTSRSYDIMPPSFNTAARPQLNLHEEGEPNSTASSCEIRLIKDQTRKSRAGFNTADFGDLNPDIPSNETFLQLDSEQHLKQSPDVDQPLGCQERIYRIVDSSVFTAILALILLFDYILCFLNFLLLLTEQTRAQPSLEMFYSALDWITAVAFLTETNARLYSYGPTFYFSSALRGCEYLVSAANAAFAVATLFSLARWLLITRFMRLIRIITLIIAWRERKLRWRTRQELETLADLLEKEKSDRSKLTKWRIESDDIAIGERAGHGGFGTVFSALFRGTLVAVKQLSLSEREPISIEDEAITLVNLRHPNVVLFMGFVHEPAKLWIVTEYCSRGSLRDLLDDDDSPLTEGRALKLALGAARGLAYLHGQDPPVLHLDLKTSNILISSGWDAKLGDFGLSRNVDNIENCFSGTVQYAAPEVLESNTFSTAADIYSFGVCLWEIAAREVPFQNESPMSVLWGVVKSNLRPSLNAICVKETEPELQDFSNDMDRNSGIAAERITKRASASRSARHIRGDSGHIEDHLAYHHHRDYTREHFGCRSHRTVASKAVAGGTEVSEGEIDEISPAEQKLSTPEQRVYDISRYSYTNCRDDALANEKGLTAEPHYSSKNSYADASRELPLKHTAQMDQDKDGNAPFQTLSAFIHQTLPMNDRPEVSSQLEDLTRRVTATIQKFDDRPPVVRRKEGDEQNRGHLDGTPRASDAHSSGIQPKFSSMIKKTFTKRNSLRTSSATSRKVHRSKVIGSESFQPPSGTTEECDAFARRLVNFSMHSNSRQIIGSQRNAEEEPAISDGSLAHCTTFEGSRRSKQSPVQVPRDYVDLIQRCWAQDPNQRPSASQIVWRLVLLIDGQMRDTSIPE